MKPDDLHEIAIRIRYLPRDDILLPYRRSLKSNLLGILAGVHLGDEDFTMRCWSDEDGDDIYKWVCDAVQNCPNVCLSSLVSSFVLAEEMSKEFFPNGVNSKNQNEFLVIAAGTATLLHEFMGMQQPLAKVLPPVIPDTMLHWKHRVGIRPEIGNEVSKTIRNKITENRAIDPPPRKLPLTEKDHARWTQLQERLSYMNSYYKAEANRQIWVSLEETHLKKRNQVRIGVENAARKDFAERQQKVVDLMNGKDNTGAVKLMESYLHDLAYKVKAPEFEDGGGQEEQPKEQPPAQEQSPAQESAAVPAEGRVEEVVAAQPAEEEEETDI